MPHVLPFHSSFFPACLGDEDRTGTGYPVVEILYRCSELRLHRENVQLLLDFSLFQAEKRKSEKVDIAVYSLNEKSAVIQKYRKVTKVKESPFPPTSDMFYTSCILLLPFVRPCTFQIHRFWQPAYLFSYQKNLLHTVLAHFFTREAFDRLFTLKHFFATLSNTTFGDL